MTTAWVDLEDMRDFLRFQEGDTSDNDQLAELVSTACECIEDLKGRIGTAPVEGESVRVERLGIVLLEQRPVLSVEAVSLVRFGDAPVAIPQSDPAAGVRGWRLASGGGVLTVPMWGSADVRLGSTLSVDYTVGVDPIPSRYVTAAKYLVQHLWDSSQQNTGGGRMDLGSEDTEYVRGMSGASYALPFKVRELLGIFGSVAKSGVMVR